MPFFAEPLATLASIRPPTVRRRMAEAKAAAAPIRHRSHAGPAGDPLDLYVGRFE